MWMLWLRCVAALSPARAGTTAVLLNGTQEPVDLEFVLIGRTVCDPCSGPIPPGGVRALPLGDATRLIIDIVGLTFDGGYHMYFSEDRRSSGAVGVSVESSWVEIDGGQLVTLVVEQHGVRGRHPFRNGFAPACGAMTDEVRACTPTVCEQGGRMVMIGALPGNGCVLKIDDPQHLIGL